MSARNFNLCMTTPHALERGLRQTRGNRNDDVAQASKEAHISPGERRVFRRTQEYRFVVHRTFVESGGNAFCVASALFLFKGGP